MARQILIILIVVVTFGILVPWYKGFGLLDPRIIAAYACLALLFVAPASTELGAVQHAEMPRVSLFSKVAIIVGYGWALTLVIVVTAFVTLNLTNRRGARITPPWSLCAASLAFGLAGSAAVVLLGVALAQRFSSGQAKSILRGLFLLALLALVSSSRVLPESWQIVLAGYTTRRAITRLAWQGAGMALVVACLLLIPLLKKPSNVEA